MSKITEFSSGMRSTDVRYALLDKDNVYKKDLATVLSGSISYNADAPIKKTAKFSIVDDGSIDYMNDRIMPYLRIGNPSGYYISREPSFLNMVHIFENEAKFVEGEHRWNDYPLGIFTLDSPKMYDDVEYIIRDINAFDLTYTIQQNKTPTRIEIPEGDLYYPNIIEILSKSGAIHHVIEYVDKRAPRTLEYEAGTSYLTIVNDLLVQAGMEELNVTNDGVMVSRIYEPPSDKNVTRKYHDDTKSVIILGVENIMDMSEAYNVFTVVRTNADEAPMVCTFENNNPNDPFSTVNRGRSIVDFRKVSDIADKDALEKLVMKMVSESSKKHGTIKFKTPLMHDHQFGEVIDFRYEQLGIEGIYEEISWDMDLTVGGIMTHEMRTTTDFRKGRWVY